VSAHVRGRCARLSTRHCACPDRRVDVFQ